MSDFDITTRTSSPRIDRLGAGEIFVFGSNLSGAHGGGAALLAVNKFGAVWGQGVGLQGQSYAIPTMHGGPQIAPLFASAKDIPNIHLPARFWAELL